MGGVSEYGGLNDHPELYKDSNLVEMPDLVVGVAPIHYADIKKDKN